MTEALGIIWLWCSEDLHSPHLWLAPVVWDKLCWTISFWSHHEFDSISKRLSAIYRHLSNCHSEMAAETWTASEWWVIINNWYLFIGDSHYAGLLSDEFECWSISFGFGCHEMFRFLYEASFCSCHCGPQRTVEHSWVRQLHIVYGQGNCIWWKVGMKSVCKFSAGLQHSKPLSQEHELGAFTCSSYVPEKIRRWIWGDIFTTESHHVSLWSCHSRRLFHRICEFTGCKNRFWDFRYVWQNKDIIW